MKRFLFLCLATGLIATGCGSFNVNEPIWSAPPPTPRVESQGESQSTHQPLFHTFGMTHYDKKNGWTIVPKDVFMLQAETSRANAVLFYMANVNETVNPETNEVIGTGEPSDDEGRRRWLATPAAPDQRSGIVYAVAYNDWGRTLSPLHFVVWYDGPLYSNEDIKPPPK